MKLRYVAASLSMFCFVGLAFWAYNKVVVEGDTSMTVPLVRAPEGPYKSPPEEPGGMDVPHQDTAIYDMLNEDRDATDEETVVFRDVENEDENVTQPSDDLIDETDGALLQKGFVLEPKQTAVNDKPSIERLFDEAEDQVALAKKNIEAVEASLDVEDPQLIVSDQDISSLAKDIEQEKNLDPEEVDAGIIIIDPTSMKDNVKAPAPFGKPKIVASNKAENKSDFNNVLDGVLKTDNDLKANSGQDVTPSSVAKIVGLERASTYASMKKPMTRRSSSSNRPVLALPSSASPSVTSSSDAVSKDFFIQLASLPSADRAAQEWALLQTRYPDILGRITTRYVDADLGDRGVYTRVQAGPYTEENAREACAALAAAGKTSGCIVVK
jgi:cell division septation protein DedD